MTRTVLVPIDDSDDARDALEYALTRHADDDIVVFHAKDPSHVYTYGGGEAAGTAHDRIEETIEEETDDLLRRAENQASDHGVAVSTATETGSPADAVVEYAEDHAVDLIVIGSRGNTGAKRLLLGSVAERVVRRSPTPVTVVR
jgi:nucleotide-binding universal stress UspA family protein